MQVIHLDRTKEVLEAFAHRRGGITLTADEVHGITMRALSIAVQALTVPGPATPFTLSMATAILRAVGMTDSDLDAAVRAIQSDTHAWRTS